MFKLYNIYRQVLKEANTKSDIVNVIEDRQVCTIYYEGDTVNNPGFRDIEPYVYGRHIKTGNEVLRAYQIKGATDTQPEGWKMFRVDRIKSLKPMRGTYFYLPRDKYRESGDAHMSQIYAQGDFI